MTGELEVWDLDDIQPRELVVKVRGREYVLREATEDAVCKWRNAQVKAARMIDGKVKGLGDIADTEPFLVSLCLFEARRNPAGELQVSATTVPINTVRAWPARVVKPLFDRIKDISDLNSDTEDALEKTIEESQKKLEKLRSVKESSAKNSLAATSANSE